MHFRTSCGSFAQSKLHLPCCNFETVAAFVCGSSSLTARCSHPTQQQDEGRKTGEQVHTFFVAVGKMVYLGKVRPKFANFVLPLLMVYIYRLRLSIYTPLSANLVRKQMGSSSPFLSELSSPLTVERPVPPPLATSCCFVCATTGGRRGLDGDAISAEALGNLTVKVWLWLVEPMHHITTLYKLGRCELFDVYERF